MKHKILTRSINTQMTKQSWRRENILPFFKNRHKTDGIVKNGGKKIVTTRTEREKKKQSRGRIDTNITKVKIINKWPLNRQIKHKRKIEPQNGGTDSQ